LSPVQKVIAKGILQRSPSPKVQRTPLEGPTDGPLEKVKSL